jgi:hypothetical protein
MRSVLQGLSTAVKASTEWCVLMFDVCRSATIPSQVTAAATTRSTGHASPTMPLDWEQPPMHGAGASHGLVRCRNMSTGCRATWQQEGAALRPCFHLKPRCAVDKDISCSPSLHCQTSRACTTDSFRIDQCCWQGLGPAAEACMALSQGCLPFHRSTD